MKQLVISLKRLYEKEGVTDERLKNMVKKRIINEDEYKFIVKK